MPNFWRTEIHWQILFSRSSMLNHDQKSCFFSTNHVGNSTTELIHINITTLAWPHLWSTLIYSQQNNVDFCQKIDLTKYILIQLGFDKSIKAQLICYKSNSNSRDFIFFPPKPSLNDSTNQEAMFELRKRKITEVCKKYKMNTGKPSPKIFKSVLCFSQFKVSR